MNYNDITFNDPNRFKRYLQKRRLDVALAYAVSLKPNPEAVCDFGAGNGELCKQIKEIWKNARIVAYEPSSDLAKQAIANVSGMSSVDVTTSTEGIEDSSMDVLFCLEVFEHLPDAETTAAIADMKRMLKPNGILVVGVPVEIGIPAIYKGVFRSMRRPGHFDTSLANIVRCAFGRPPTERPLGEIEHGFRYHFEHVGFDYRALKKVLSRHFKSVKTGYSPVNWTFGMFMPEVYFTLASPIQMTK